MAAKASSGGDGTQAEGDATATPAADGGAAPDPGAIPPAADPAAPDGSTPPADGGAAAETPLAAAPLTPPPAKAPAQPPADARVEPNAAVPQAPDGASAIVAGDGSVLGPDGLFADHGGHFTWLEAATDIFRRFHFPGQHRDSMKYSTHLVARRGTRIPRDEAHQIAEEARNGGAPAADGGTAEG